MNKEFTCICKICGEKFQGKKKSCCICSDVCKGINFKINRKKITCDKCGREISVTSFKKHYETCDGTYFTGARRKTKISSEITEECFINNEWICPLCNKQFKSRTALLSHYWKSHTEEGIIHSKEFYRHANRRNGAIAGTYLVVSDETREKLRQSSLNNPRGIAIHPEWRSVNGNSLKVPYIDSYGKECQLDSSWEWKMANELDKSGINWKRAYHFWLGGGKSYTPDFYLPDYDLYLDPKGWKNPEQMIRIDIWLEKYKKNFLIIDKYENLNWNYIKTVKGI